MEQIIKDIVMWMNGESVAMEALRQFLRNKGFSEDDINYIARQLTDYGFSVMNNAITYRGLNYRAPLPPSQP